jgi:rare lipoprotein A
VHPLGRANAAAAATLAIALAACGGAAKQGAGKRVGAASAPTPTGDVQHGMASWYGHGRGTASGERFNRRALTAAHRSFPFNTLVRVTNQRNGRSVIVRINDRGPFGGGRIIDVSEAAAEQLGMKRAGVVPVTLERLK